MVVLYVPAEHAAHTPPSGPVYPALHIQFATLTLLLYGEYEFSGHDVHPEAPAFEYVPALQSRHGSEPFVPLYLPASQDVQFPPSGPVKFAGQMQCVRITAAGGDTELSGH